MTFGSEYAGIYDALYKSKDYVSESRFVLDQVRDAIPPASHLLDLGCGTGLHATEMARSGYSVTGIDRSQDMIALAQGRAKALPENLARRLRFEVGDMCSLDLKQNFAAVFSLFHVICYMTDDDMLQAALATMRRHLQPGGTLLFDFWYADAVRSSPPEQRERVIEAEGQRIRRLTKPRWEPEKSLVHITYEVEIIRDNNGAAVHSQETHSIRYFSCAELETKLAQAGFSTIRFGEWLTGAAPSEQSFGVYCLARANG